MIDIAGSTTFAAPIGPMLAIKTPVAKQPMIALPTSERRGASDSVSISPEALALLTGEQIEPAKPST